MLYEITTMTISPLKDDFALDITISLAESDDIATLTRHAAKKLGVSVRDVPPLEIKRKSIDARRGAVNFVFTLGLVDEGRKARISERLTKPVAGEPVIIVGAGPAGLFCAYELARAGIKSIVLDRGKMVQERRKDLKGLNQHGYVDEDSNYCFGEGGAGTYSDGKLYTRSHKRGSVREVLETLVAHGAKREILTDGRPHIGSNKLPKVITALRESLEAVGVEFHFGARVVDLLVETARVRGVRTLHGNEFVGRSVVIAAGHSARDVITMLARHGVLLEAKPFAMGVRIEHPQALINQMQFGKWAGHEKLPPAYYRLAYTPADGRGAFSFCMCPGGWIVPASTQKSGLVINGMSLSKRDSAYANSGFVVAISIEDVVKRGFRGPTGGIDLQEELEAYALKAGGGGLVAPANRVVDFIKDRVSQDLPATSYLPGLNPVNLHEVLAITQLPIAERLKDALRQFDKVMPGYITNEAILVGVESRTSSPVRVMRDQRALNANLPGLYPCGEGAGYAGGIMSAAMDGIAIARQIALQKP